MFDDDDKWAMLNSPQEKLLQALEREAQDERRVEIEAVGAALEGIAAERAALKRERDALAAEAKAAELMERASVGHPNVVTPSPDPAPLPMVIPDTREGGRGFEIWRVPDGEDRSGWAMSGASRPSALPEGMEAMEKGMPSRQTLRILKSRQSGASAALSQFRFDLGPWAILDADQKECGDT